ncbi:MAG: hypothetical protein J7L43_02215 [Candidatus Aenigmarchaeota archaeon]|nr:hypothetical protein [Candidatus Aenigmarchaeota archaeon]
MPKEEFELVPLDPIRSLEKKVEKLEAVVKGKAVNEDFFELIKTNQQVVDDLIKMNTELISKMTKLSNSIENLVKKFDEFLKNFEIAKVEVGEGGKVEGSKSLEEENRRLREMQEELLDKFNRLERKVNALILSKIPLRKTEKRV